MTRRSADADVIVVGGGPVGLYLAAELARRGADVTVIERRLERHDHSRSIGIHPPALKALSTIGAGARLIEEGVQIRRGWAFSDRGQLGSISFETLPEPYPFVLALPQHRTEAILESRLDALAPGALRRGCVLDDIEQDGDCVRAAGRRFRADMTAAEPFVSTAPLLVGCDGRNSAVRSSAEIAFDGFTYPDSYLMGDFPDETALGADAAIYLTDAGVIESFPLPGAFRRWVVKTAERHANPSPGLLADLIGRRVAVSVAAQSCSMVSSFGSERAIASRLVKGRVALAGDSAHLVPPIGGQGMNIGWLDAADLAPRLLDVLGGTDPAAALAAYADGRARAARAAMRRADLNLRLGRATRWGVARDALVRLMLARPFARLTARMFTMRGLG